MKMAAVMQLDKMVSLLDGVALQVCILLDILHRLFAFLCVLVCVSLIDNDEGKRPVLQQISLAIVNNTECANFYARFSANTRDPIIISSSQICAQGSANRDACQGIILVSLKNI